jgi:hypothetical protein
LGVSQALALCAIDDERRAFTVVIAERRASVVAERELVHVAVKVALADVVKRAIHTALDQREKALEDLCVSGATLVFADPLFFADFQRDETEPKA